MAEKKYLKGNGKEVVFEDGSSIVNVWIDLDDAKEQGLITKTKSGKNGISFTVAKRSKPSEYGDTHYLYNKAYDPNGKTKYSTPATKQPAVKPPTGTSYSSENDLPF